MTELLAPAGDESSAYAALLAGADAVYLGLEEFSARQSAVNFSAEALARVTRFAHLLGAKVYVALNTLVREGELPAFFRAALAAWNGGADAILLQDIFLGRALKEAYPEMQLHLSTQAGCCNVHGARLARRFGFSRAVLARETPLSDMAAISSVIETEVFVQGALCACVSGQCYLSSFAGGNSGNRGRCKQPCRKRYRIDRAPFSEPAYALSLSDLCVGDRIAAFRAAGVTSFKIEGRMRSAAYAAAAVRYYRALLDGGDAVGAFSDLARAFNRGGYTQGLAFGQDGSLLSRRVQGHIGERVGVLTRRDGKFFCKSSFAAQRGDGFKLLRGGKEAGGAVFLAAGEGGFYLASSDALAVGDEVRVTTDTASARRVLEPAVRRTVRVDVRMRAGEPMRAACEGYVLEGAVCEAAKNAPLSAEEIAANFARADALPLRAETAVDTRASFVPKSVLNAFRRAFYRGLAEHLAPVRAPLAPREVPMPTSERGGGALRAVMVAEGMPLPQADFIIWKPADYTDMHPPRGVWLYLPPFLTAADEAAIAPALPQFEGIFCEGTYGICFAETYGTALFGGTGWNITNSFAAAGAAQAAAYFTLSKEIDAAEQSALSHPRAFALSAGEIKVMDLAFCPFGRTCAACDRRPQYTMTDDAGRRFPLRRYRAAGGCRFEVYNCAPLAADMGAPSALIDHSIAADGARTATKGHTARSVL